MPNSASFKIGRASIYVQWQVMQDWLRYGTLGARLIWILSPYNPYWWTLSIDAGPYYGYISLEWNNE